jgi:hypothetical protein
MKIALRCTLFIFLLISGDSCRHDISIYHYSTDEEAIEAIVVTDIIKTLLIQNPKFSSSRLLKNV